MKNSCMLSIELDILHNKIWDVCSFYAVQVLLSPMVSGWAVGGLSTKREGWFSINLSMLYLINHKG